MRFDWYEIGLVAALVCAVVLLTWLYYPSNMQDFDKTKGEIICADFSSNNCIGPK